MFYRCSRYVSVIYLLVCILHLLTSFRLSTRSSCIHHRRNEYVKQSHKSLIRSTKLFDIASTITDTNINTKLANASNSIAIAVAISSTPTKKKVYEPRSATYNATSTYKAPSPSAPTTWIRPASPNNTRRNDDRWMIILSSPQVLIRYKFVKQKSETKIRLESMQNSFKQQHENNGGSTSSYSNYKPRSYDNKPAAGGGGLSFPPSDTSRYAKRGGVKPKSSSSKNDGQREGSGRREKKDEFDDDDDDYYDEEDVAGYDPFAGDTGDFVSLSTLSSDTLRSMKAEGSSLSEMQSAIFGEYGIKATIQALKKRIKDDKFLARKMKRSGKTRRDRANVRKARLEGDVNIVFLPKAPRIQVIELAELIGVGGGEVVKHLMMNVGLMVTLTQNVEIEVAKQIVLAFGKTLQAENETEEEEDAIDDADDDDDNDGGEVTGTVYDTVPRPPVVTIMGHVDHGKTTLLDRIRKLAAGESISSNFVPVAPTEAGGITQSISAFKVKTDSDQYVTFIDTPGHAAFSDMRKRGANVTDIVVLVVAADDGIMDQTKECIFAAKAAGCPIVVAINKIDKQGADAQSVLTDLMNYDILVEEFGGQVQAAELSAKRGIGIEGLLEKLLLQAEVMSLTAKVGIKPSGTIIESRIDKRLGTVATVLVQKGVLKVGDIMLAGKGWGRVRKMLSDQGDDLKEAGPSTPVQLLGFSTIPGAGDEFIVVEEESAARNVAEARIRLARQASASSSGASMKSNAASLSGGVYVSTELIKVPLVVKADVSGSVEALRSSLEAIKSSDETATCAVDLVQMGIGEVTASDVAIAAVSKAKILAFNVGVKTNVLELAKASNVDIGFYTVVYELLNEIDKQVRETISPPPPGVLIGKAEVKKSFRVGKSGKVAGCSVTEGSIKAHSKVRIMRGNRNPIYNGQISSLRSGKDALNEVGKGGECGIQFDDFQDFQEGDIVECFSIDMESLL